MSGCLFVTRLYLVNSGNETVEMFINIKIQNKIDIYGGSHTENMIFFQLVWLDIDNSNK